MRRDLVTRILSGVAFPMHEFLKGQSSVSVRRELERTQWLPPDRLERYRVERLRWFLGEIGRDVPYYRSLFRERGFDPGAVTSLDALRTLPLLTKQDLRAQASAMTRPGAKLRTMSTGGSTGAPLRFYLSAERVSHDVAAKWRATRWWDVDIGDREVVLWGSPIELGRQDRMRLYRDRLFRSTLLPAFEMSEARLREYLDALARIRPAMLFGYPSALAHLGRSAERAGRDARAWGVRVAFATGEVLLPDQRATVERVFGAPVANGYGGRDAGFVAHECPQGGFHLTAEDLVVELLDDGGRPVAEGETGEIVVTHMATRDFPFVRYRTGDLGSMRPGTCPCGRSLPMLASVQGRQTDFVVAADGTVLHGLSLIYVMRELEGVDAFRIVQESLERTRVEVVAPMVSEAMRRTIVDGFRARLGGDVTVEVHRADALPQQASGKYRYVESRVSLPDSGDREP